MILLITIAILATMVTLIYLWLGHQERQSERAFAERNLKYVKMGNLFAQTLNKEPIHLVKDEYIKREGPVFGFNMLNKYTIMVTDVDIIHTVLNKEFFNFTNRREFPGFNKLLNENVAMVPDEQWKRLRSISTPAFSVGKLKRMKPCIDETIATLLKNVNAKLEQEGSIQNVKTIFDAFTIDTLIQIAFGLKVDSLNDPSNPIIVNGRKLFQHDVPLKELIKGTITFIAPSVAQFFGIEVLKEVTNFFIKMSIQIMDQKREEYKRQKSDGYSSKAESFLEFMLEAEMENQKLNEEDTTAQLDTNGNPIKRPTKYMTTDEIISQCIMFFLAGFDTTATALTVSAYQLALNPDKQKKLYLDTMEVLEKLKQEQPDEEDPFKLVTYDNLPRFEYLTAVLNEALRLASPGIFVERRVAKETELTNADGSIRFKVKPEDIIHVPVYSIHRIPKYFADPETFIPERFTEEATSDSFNKNAYLPFGSGPRNCIAKSMALLESKLALLHVIRSYRFEACEQTKIPMEFYNQFDLITPKDATLRMIKRV